MTEHEKKMLSLLDDFSNINHQIESWFGIGKSVLSADEVCCRIEDFGFFSWVKEKFSDNDEILIEYVKIFENNIENLPEIQDNFRAISSPEWSSLRIQASVIKNIIINKLK